MASKESISFFVSDIGHKKLSPFRAQGTNVLLPMLQDPRRFYLHFHENVSHRGEDR